MSALLLIGFVTGTARHVAQSPKHLRIPIRGWTAIAINAAEGPQADETQIVTWATTQNEILSNYIKTQDVLPVALGSVFSTEAALLSHVETHWESLTEAADDLAGQCEYSLYVEADSREPEQVGEDIETDGRSFLAARRSRRDSRAQLGEHRMIFLQDITRRVQSHAHRLVNIPRTRAGRVTDIAVLVSRGDAPSLIATLADCAPRASELGLHCRMVGPSPAFSFVTKEVQHV